MRVVQAQPSAPERWPTPIRWCYRGLKRVVPITWDRDDLPRLLNRLNLTGRGVEVGVQRGLFSETILSRWKGRELVSIDPWCRQNSYDDPANVSDLQQERFLLEARRRLNRFGWRSAIWRETGDEAAEWIPDGTLDFVYLDARHDYDSVLNDIQVWWAKVKPGGILAGHDYLDAVVLFDGEAGTFEVKRAVDTHFPEGVRRTFSDGPWHSWFVRK